MARKRHGGLGRGLDALIPQTPKQSAEKQETAEQKKTQARQAGTADAETAQAEKEGPETEQTETIQAETIQAETIPSETVQSESGQEEGVSVRQDGAAQTDVRMLRLSQVDPNRSQPRQNFEDAALDELAESIRQFGVLQPILVQKKGSRYEIIAGERRWRASRKAGITEIPAIVREYSDQETLELSLIENIQREDLNPIEEAKAFRRLLDEFGLRQEDLAARVSKSRTAITNSVRLLKLDERVQGMLEEDRISMGHARALLPIEIGEEQFLLARQIEEKSLSVREVEKLVKNRTSKKKDAAGRKAKKEENRDPALELAYRSIEERLRQSLGTKASIHSVGDGSGRIEIDFYSHEDLEKIVDLLT